MPDITISLETASDIALQYGLDVLANSRRFFIVFSKHCVAQCERTQTALFDAICELQEEEEARTCSIQ